MRLKNTRAAKKPRRDTTMFRRRVARTDIEWFDDTLRRTLDSPAALFRRMRQALEAQQTNCNGERAAASD